MPESTISEIAEVYLNWQKREGLSKVITKEKATQNNYNLSPSR